MDDKDRLRQLDALLVAIDAPSEGDEVMFTIKGHPSPYRGIIKVKKMSTGVAQYQIQSKTKPAPIGRIDSIIYKGKVFKAESKSKPDSNSWKEV